jgi:hypothetical protein
MKKRLLILSIILSSTLLQSVAQKKFTIGTYTVNAAGALASTIKLVDYKNKELGNLFTYYEIGAAKITTTSISTDKKLPYLIIKQSITKESAIGLILDITVQKSVNDGMQNTLPKNYWDVSIAFKNSNAEYVETGNTEYYKKDGTSTTKTEYTGTSYVIPFSTKKAADAFAAKAKQFFK